jgi:hypothetical protein
MHNVVVRTKKESKQLVGCIELIMKTNEFDIYLGLFFLFTQAVFWEFSWMNASISNIVVTLFVKMENIFHDDMINGNVQKMSSWWCSLTLHCQVYFIIDFVRFEKWTFKVKLQTIYNKWLEINVLETGGIWSTHGTKPLHL